ncbi:MAG: translation elongation factor 4, partial [Desulfovibrio sp.]|nr:translation elongation factor 4 [Desulfovibrio sp.]
VLNKIDLPSADPARVRGEIEEGIGLDCAGALEVSAKTGLGVDKVLEAIIERLPPPDGDREAPLKALIFDSWYDSYQGVVTLFRVMDGRIRKGDRIRLMSTGKEYEALRLGVFSPEAVDVDELAAGEVGFLSGSIKELGDARVGDTITLAGRPAAEPVPGFKEVKPVVFCGLYPTESDEYENLKAALEKLQLNDAAFSFEPETSQALGFGFRCGFLGLLHMEIIQERLEREFEVGLIATAPSVIYKVETTDGQTLEIDNPSRLPDPSKIRALYEPYVRMDIHVPNEYVGNVMKLCEEKRGEQKNLHYLAANRVVVTYELPFAEIVYDFFDRLKSVTRGYASMDYEPVDYRPSDLVRLDILLNGEPVDALAVIVHRERAYPYGRGLALKLKRTIPRQLFQVAIQAAIGQKIIARETVSAFRKDVTAKCYGGDITRKRKLLEKQKEGKKRMKRMGNVELPQEAFLAALKVGDE